SQLRLFRRLCHADKQELRIGGFTFLLKRALPPFRTCARPSPCGRHVHSSRSHIHEGPMKKISLVSSLLCTALVFGCGDDGKPGATGATGPTGSPTSNQTSDSTDGMSETGAETDAATDSAGPTSQTSPTSTDPTLTTSGPTSD